MSSIFPERKIMAQFRHICTVLATRLGLMPQGE
jgi:hypothetical protein